jgi:hypothetical protein
LGKEVKERTWRPRLVVAVAAAALVMVSGFGLWRLWGTGFNSHFSNQSSWQVVRLDGAPRIGSEQIRSTGRLGVGEWLETDGSSRAQIAVSSIGTVEER